MRTKMLFTILGLTVLFAVLVGYHVLSLVRVQAMEDYSPYFQQSQHREMVAAIQKGDAAAVLELLAAGVDPATLGENAANFPSVAIDARQRGILGILLEAGAVRDPTGKVAGNAMYTAVVSGDVGWVRMLHAAGADLNNYGGGDLLLKSAYFSGDRGVVDYFLANGAEIDKPTVGGGTVALALATIADYAATAELLRRGASPLVMDESGLTIGFLCEDRAKIRTWDFESEAERQRQEVLGLLEAAGFPFPAPDPEIADEMRRAGNWPPG